MSFLGREASHFPPPERRLRLGFVGGGRGSFIGAVHANGARLSNRWCDLVTRTEFEVTSLTQTFIKCQLFQHLNMG